jgi:hypothetical protein
MTTRQSHIEETDVAELERRLSQELPGFAVRYKDESRLQRLIGRLLWPFNRHYLTRYTTVLFGRVYFPSRSWRERAGARTIYGTLRHEAVHLRDARRFPGLFQVSYLFLLPFVFTTRAYWEWRAYLETMRVWAELEGEIPDELLDHIQRCFTGPDYLFMRPFPRFVRRKLEEVRKRLLPARYLNSTIDCGREDA